jgi:hypothetical protein
VHSLLEAIDLNIDKKPQAVAHLNLIYAVLWDLWLSRNSHQFQGTSRVFSAQLVSQQADDNIYAVCMATPPSTKLHRLQEARGYLLASPNLAFEM